MSDPQEAFEQMARAPLFLLSKQAALHLGLWILAFSLFAAADSWAQLTDWLLATLLSVLTGLIAGFVSVNLAHEWGHYLGARLASGNVSIRSSPALFIFDWDFGNNGLGQFYVMSIGGSLGGALALIALGAGVEIDNPGRAALFAGAVASFAFGSIVEWPVLLRTRKSRNPEAELSRLSPGALGRAGLASALLALASLWLL